MTQSKRQFVDDLNPQMKWGEGLENKLKFLHPTWREIENRIGGAYVMCSCGRTLTTIEQTREHWQLGHFDKRQELKTFIAHEKETAKTQERERCLEAVNRELKILLMKYGQFDDLTKAVDNLRNTIIKNLNS